MIYQYKIKNTIILVLILYNNKITKNKIIIII